MRAMRSGRRRQGGYYTLFSAAAALTIFGILMASQASQYASQGRDDAAQSAGVMAGQFKNALRAMIAERRSEERRVGKECRCGRQRDRYAEDQTVDAAETDERDDGNTAAVDEDQGEGIERR